MNASEKSEAIALHKAQGSVHVPHTTAEGTRNVITVVQCFRGK